MPVEGRDLSSRQAQQVGKDLGDWATYKLHNGFGNCEWRRTRKRRQKPAIVSTPCTTRSAARTYWPMRMLSAAPTRARRVWTDRTLRTSRRMGCSGGSANGRLRIRELIAKHKADGFGEGDVSNNYLRDRYSKDI